MLIDKYGRPLTHMRISVTNRCNHECLFCHHEGINDQLYSELDFDDWVFVVDVAYSLGIKYYKITGGEPLLRSDIVDIVNGISSVGGLVSIVTNGSLLKHYAKDLSETKLSHINVSLHSLRSDVFYRITRGYLDRVLEGIREALDYGIKVKIDYVVLSINIKEFRDILDFAERKGIDINIIELIPLGISREDYNRLHTPLDKIIDYLEKHSIEKHIREFQSRPVYILSSGVKAIVIKGFCNPELCMKCTRVRMTPDGRIKTCLFRNDNLVNAREYIVNRDREGLIEAFKKANMLREPFFKPKRRG